MSELFALRYQMYNTKKVLNMDDVSPRTVSVDSRANQIDPLTQFLATGLLDIKHAVEMLSDVKTWATVQQKIWRYQLSRS